MKLSLRGMLAYLLATAVFLIILIAAGLFDPKPVGQLQTTLPAQMLTVSESGQTIVWLEEITAEEFSVRGITVWQSGSLDSGMGLAVGNEQDAFVAAVSPLGYVLVQQDDTVILPWQPWPHVQPEENEIWLDVRGETITVRINREILWQGTYTLTGKQVGLLGENFGDTAVYKLNALEIFAE